jgi:putative ABC transport system permease protein
VWGVGLFGLILFVMRARTREIGIRQVHGATAASLLRMFTGEFVKLMLIANLIAWPLAWLVIQNWLERFVFRISIDALPFVLAAIITLLLTMAMVTYHVIRTLRANPVESLKYE